MAFKLRLIDVVCYQILAQELGLVESGDRAACDRLADQCQAELERGDFQRRNPRHWIVRHFSRSVDEARARGGADAVALLAGPALALLCMPDFRQMLLPVGHPDPAIDSLCQLGDSDGGLYAWMVHIDPAIPEIFDIGFSSRSERHELEGRMFLLSREEVARLLRLAEQGVSDAPDAARGASERLRQLCLRALANTRWTVAVTGD